MRCSIENSSGVVLGFDICLYNSAGQFAPSPGGVIVEVTRQCETCPFAFCALLGELRNVVGAEGSQKRSGIRSPQPIDSVALAALEAQLPRD